MTPAMTQISVYMLYGKIFFGFIRRHVYLHNTVYTERIDDRVSGDHIQIGL